MHRFFFFSYVFHNISYVLYYIIVDRPLSLEVWVTPKIIFSCYTSVDLLLKRFNRRIFVVDKSGFSIVYSVFLTRTRVMHTTRYRVNKSHIQPQGENRDLRRVRGKSGFNNNICYVVPIITAAVTGQHVSACIELHTCKSSETSKLSERTEYLPRYIHIIRIKSQAHWTVMAIAELNTVYLPRRRTRQILLTEHYYYYYYNNNMHTCHVSRWRYVRTRINAVLVQKYSYWNNNNNSVGDNSITLSRSQ